MTEVGKPVAESFSARLIRREAERRATMELATSTPAGLESALARISAEVTAERQYDDAQKSLARSGKVAPTPTVVDGPDADELRKAEAIRKRHVHVEDPQLKK